MAGIRYIVDQIGQSGQRSRKIDRFDKSTLKVGRGGSSDIILKSRFVSLEHALFRVEETSLIVERLPHGGNISVDGREIARAALKNGQKVSIGDVEIEILLDDGDWWLIEVRESVVQDDSIASRTIERLSVSRYLSAIGSCSIAAAVLIAVGALLWPTTSGEFDSWSSGPLARPHQFLSHDCAACHTDHFSTIKDSACEECHSMNSHAEQSPELVSAISKAEGNCVDCHKDHRGVNGAIIRDSKLCAECHGSLRRFGSEITRQDFADFSKHAEFAVSVPGANGEPAKRVRLDNNAELVDRTPLKLNHRVHLEGPIDGPNGPVTLTCNSCHELSQDLRSVNPIRFEDHCQSCHQLGFDSRIPDKTVPHGDADAAFNFIYAEYAKLALRARSAPDRAQTDEIPRFRQLRSAPHENVVALTEAAVLAEARDTERLLFEKTGCFLCHEVRAVPGAPGETRAQYEIVEPKVVSDWMPGVQFQHGAHKELTCDSCHAAPTSERTSDVLLPKIALCRECHAQEHVPGKVESDCVLCHSYHDEKLLESHKQRTKESVRRALKSNHP